MSGHTTQLSASSHAVDHLAWMQASSCIFKCSDVVRVAVKH